MPYTPDPTNPATPSDSTPIGTASSEFRVLKQHLLNKFSTLDTNIAANVTAINNEATTRAQEDAAETARAVAAEAALTDSISSLADSVTVAIAAAITNVKNEIFHIGAYFITHTNISPDVLLGMSGTSWVRVSAGYGLISRDPSDVDLATAGGLLGASEVNISNANIPSHTHGVTDPGHAHTVPGKIPQTKETIRDGGTADVADNDFIVSPVTGSSPTGISIQPTANGTTPLNIRNPSVIANIWRRTA